MKKKIIIIGAGTIGLHCAFYLHQSGFEVEVLEASDESDESGCSYGNCGLLVPSHFIPLASPAMLRSGMKMLFDRKSPVYLPLARNIGNFPWFVKFMQAATQSKVDNAIPTLYKLNEESRKRYSELSALSGNKMVYEHRGMLMASTTEKGLEEEIEIARIGNRLGIETQFLNNGDLKKLEPEVDFNISGAILYKSDGHIDPVLHMQWLKSFLKEAGVVIHHGTTVDSFDVSKGKIVAVKSGTNNFKADEFVLAAGAASSKLAAKLSVSLPIISGKGYSIDFSKNELKINTPLIFTEAKVAITPFADRVRLGSGMEFSGSVGEVRKTRVQAMLDRTRAALPSMSEMKTDELEIWEGLRPVTPGGVPYIGRTKKIDNLLIAAGHAMMGVSLGPITGQIISRLAQGKSSGFDERILCGN